MFAVDMVPVVVVVVVLPVAAFDLASAAFCASRAAFRLGLAPIITLKDNLEMRKKKTFWPNYISSLITSTDKFLIVWIKSAEMGLNMSRKQLSESGLPKTSKINSIFYEKK